MKNTIIILLILVANTSFGQVDKITKKQSDLIHQNSKDFPDQTQLAIALIKDGDVFYYGLKRDKDTVSRFDNHKSIFEIGSITKVFTSTLLAGFVMDEKIKLNENINDYLNFPLNEDTKVSFKEMSNHSSGLPRLPTNMDLTKINPADPYRDYNEAKLEDYLRLHLDLPQNQIGKYLYSNLGAGIIGYTLSKIEGISFDSLLQKRIFDKYGMIYSTTHQSKVKEELVKGLNNLGNEVSNWEFSVLAGAGGIFSNVEDLSKFALAQFDSRNRELELTRQKTFEINSNMDIGLGWHILKSKTGNKWNWHNGGTGGYSSSMAIDANNKTGVVILSNVSAFNPNKGNIDKLCFELMETLEKE